MVAFKNSTGIKANSSFCTFRFPIAEAHQLTKPFQYQPITTISPTQPFAHFVFMPIHGRIYIFIKLVVVANCRSHSCDCRTTYKHFRRILPCGRMRTGSRHVAYRFRHRGAADCRSHRLRAVVHRLQAVDKTPGGGAQALRLSQQHGCLDRQDNDGDRSNRRQYPRTCAHRRRQLAGCQRRRIANRRRDKGACDWLRQHHSHRGARRGITS